MKYGKTKPLPYQTNSILVKAWDAFNVSVVKFTRDIFVKKKLPCFSPTYFITNIQEYVSSVQVSFGSKI